MAIASESAGRMLAEMLGIQSLGIESGHDIKAACVSCESSDAFRLHQDTGVAFCHSCSGRWSPLQLAEHFTRDQREAFKILEQVGLAEPRYETNGHAPATSGPAGDALEFIARQKKVPAASFVAYGAVAKGNKLHFPMFGPDGRFCSTFTLDMTGGKGLYQKGKPTGLFLPTHEWAQKSTETIPIDGAVRLPKPGETWHIVEGVKDAAALPRSSMSSKFARLFAGANVVEVPDRDLAGEEGAKKTAANLRGVAASIKMAALPTEFRPTKGDDVRDVLNGPGGREAVLQAIADASPWTPAPAAPLDMGVDELSIATPRGRTDLANAKRFVAFAGEDVRHVGPRRVFVVWDGKRWKPDDSFLVEQKAKESIPPLWAQVAALASTASESDVATLIQYARASSNAAAIRNMLALVRSEPAIAISPADLDSDPNLLTVENGTIDLRTGDLRPHSRADLITKLCPLHYDPAATCPLWESCMLLWMNGDAEMARYMQRWVGYCLTGSVREQAMLLAYGHGSNGKSLCLNTILGVLGPCYAIKCASDFLMVRQGEGHPTDRADLAGVRFACCNEVDDGKRLSESLVKELTGSDPVRARRMREDFWEFIPSHKLWLATNHKPGVRGTDHGIWRRLKLVEFGVRIEGDQKDDRLDEKLRAEWPGILTWAVRGCLEWQKIGLAHPQKVEFATLNYRAEMDVVGLFLADCTVCGDTFKTMARDLYVAYRRWCNQVGEHEVSQRRFGQVLTERGFERDKSNGVRYVGLGLLSAWDSGESN